MELDAAMARMGLSVPDHLKPAVQAKQEPKKLSLKEQKALEEKQAEEKRRKKAAKLALNASGGSTSTEPKEKKEKVPAKKKEEKKDTPAASDPVAEAKTAPMPSKQTLAAWNEVGKVKVGVEMEDGPVMPYMRKSLPWMKYTARTKEEIEAVARMKEAELERQMRERAAKKAQAAREAEAATVRREIGKGKLGLSLEEWQTIYIASETGCV